MADVAINGPIMGREEAAAATKVVRSGVLTSAAFEGGPRVQALERTAASFVGTKYAVAVNSGTAALQAALHALGVGRGDEVLIPSFTFVATANAVVSTGARPVFVDISRGNYTMDVADLEQKITKKTRAIVPVHLYGNVADVDCISEISRRYNIPVVEDAAQSMGSSYQKRQTGGFFEAGCFSMYPGKVMTSGEGGFITTNKRDLRDKMRMIRNHGMLRGGDSRMLGINMRLPEIGAAIAEIQIRRLPGFLAARKKNATMLSGLLVGADIALPEPRRGEEPNWYMYTIASDRRDALRRELARGGGRGRGASFGAAVYYSVPVHRMPFYQSASKHATRGLTNTDWAADAVLSLPVHPKVTGGQIKAMAGIIRQNM